MKSRRHDVNQLATKVAGAMPDLNPTEQRVAGAVFFSLCGVALLRIAHHYCSSAPAGVPRGCDTLAANLEGPAYAPAEYRHPLVIPPTFG